MSVVVALLVFALLMNGLLLRDLVELEQRVRALEQTTDSGETQVIRDARLT